ncbi:MAG: FecR domain-containing protein [Spirochaetaceae bacterium]|nr:FecR domain-containing protein [Spirochaetaceae bacterium]
MAKKLLGLVFFIFLVSSFCFADSGKAEVISFSGKVEYQTPTGWVPLKAGDKLDQGTVISTGFKSSAVLKIGGSTFTVAPLSRIEISKLVLDDNGHDTEMQLTAGKMKMDVKPVSGKSVSFKIKSPAATASIRGTSGEFSVDGVLKAETGIWSYSSKAGKKYMNVVAGQQIHIESTGAVVKPYDVAKDSAIGKSGTKTLTSEETSISTGNKPSVLVTMGDTPLVVKANATIEVEVEIVK